MHSVYDTHLAHRCILSQCLEELDLSRNQLVEVPLAQLCEECPELRKIDLRSNHLQGGVPKEVGMLKKLEELYLSFNRLTGELPVEICRYPQYYL
jgi:Leucine-rich repeat (LRR) protein